MSGAEWDPILHVEAEAKDPDKPPKKGADTKAHADSKSAGKGDPVSLTLSLPPEFISAMWGYGDQLGRLAMAIEENTKAVLKLVEKNDRDPGPDR